MPNWKFFGILVFCVFSLLFTNGTGWGTSEKIYEQLFKADQKELLNIIQLCEAKLQTCPNDVETLKILGIAYHNLGAGGQKGAGGKAFNCLEKAYRLSSEKDKEVLVYLGSAETLIGRDDVFPIFKINRVNKGTEKIDNAVKVMPDNLVIRIVRIENTLALPVFFKREYLIKKDISYLLDLYEKHKSISPLLLSSLYCKLAAISRKEPGQLQKSLSYYKKAIEFAPDSKYAREAREMLAIFEGK